METLTNKPHKSTPAAHEEIFVTTIASSSGSSSF